MKASETEYTPHGTHRDFWRCRDRFVLCDGPSGTGKTRAVLEKVLLYAMKYPGVRVLLTRKTRVSMTETVLVTMEEFVLPEDSPLRIGGPHRAGRTRYRLANGSELVLCGLDNPDRLMSSDYDMAVIFEATEATLDDWEKINTRLRHGRGPYHQLVADCNPSAPHHWLKRLANDGTATRFASTHVDNPVVTDEYMAALDKLTGHRHARLRRGLWAAAEGLVFPDLEAAFIEPWSELPDGRFAGGVDFGFNDPFAALGAWLTDEGQLYVYYERYLSRTAMEVHAAALKAVHHGPWFADPSRPDSIRDLRKAGLTVRKATNSILAGVDKVSARLAAGTLLISTACSSLREEGRVYRYPDNPKKGMGEKPVDEFNHAMDALRYMVAGVDARKVAIHDEHRATAAVA